MGAYITLHKYDNKLYEFSPIKNKEKPASGQNKVRADIFSGSLAVCLFASASRLRTASVGQARRGGRKGGLVFALPPAEPAQRASQTLLFPIGGGGRIRTCKPLRALVFGTSTMAILSLLQN